MNNPSSMFGHTLLRIDCRHRRTPICSRTAVNFSADTGGDGGVAFAFKGILGYYDGPLRDRSVLRHHPAVRRLGAARHLGIPAHVRRRPDRPAARASLGAARRQVRLLLLRRELLVPDPRAARRGAARPRSPIAFRGWVIPADTVRGVVADAGSGLRRRVPAVRRHAPAPRRRRDAARAERARLGDRRRHAPRPTIRRWRRCPTTPRAPPCSAPRTSCFATAISSTARRRPTSNTARARFCSRAARCRSRAAARARADPRGAARPGPRQQPRARRHRRARRPVLRRGRHPAGLSRPARSRRRLSRRARRSTSSTCVFRYYTKDRDPRVERFTLLDIMSLSPLDAFFHPDLVDGRHRPLQSPPPQPAQRARRGVRLALARRSPASPSRRGRTRSPTASPRRPSTRARRSKRITPSARRARSASTPDRRATAGARISTPASPASSSATPASGIAAASSCASR